MVFHQAVSHVTDYYLKLRCAVSRGKLWSRTETRSGADSMSHMACQKSRFFTLKLHNCCRCWCYFQLCCTPLTLASGPNQGRVTVHHLPQSSNTGPQAMPMKRQ